MSYLQDSQQMTQIVLGVNQSFQILKGALL